MAFPKLKLNRDLEKTTLWALSNHTKEDKCTSTWEKGQSRALEKRISAPKCDLGDICICRRKDNNPTIAHDSEAHLIR